MPIDQIVTASIADSAVVTADIATGAVTADKLAVNAARANFGAGAILQVVQTVTTTSTTTSSTSNVTTNITGAITPSSASSRILVIVSLGAVYSNQGSASGIATFALFRNGVSRVDPWFVGTRLIGANFSPINGGITQMLLDTPATTSATTYTVFFRTDASSIPQTVQWNSNPSYMTLIEVAA